MIYWYDAENAAAIVGHADPLTLDAGDLVLVLEGFDTGEDMQRDGKSAGYLHALTSLRLLPFCRRRFR